MSTDLSEAPPVDRSRPPERSESPMQWVRSHLFATWYDSLLTVVLGAGILWAVTGLIRFFAGKDYEIIRVFLTFFMVGQFPREQLWRPALALVLTGALLGLAAGLARAAARARAEEAGLPFDPAGPLNLLRRYWPILLFLVVVLSFARTIGPWLLVGGALASLGVTFLLAARVPARFLKWGWGTVVVMIAVIYQILRGGGVGWDEWGGLQINLFLTVAGIVLAFPLGLLLALGRRSSLPALRTVCVTYIELIRGVPLITLLLMGIFVIGFFLPDFLDPGAVTRVLIAIVLFEAAYIAEVVRGGLQSVPRGQVEAAQALGMRPWGVTRRVVVPQALRATIPAMVGQFISLFKDTTLVSIVGMPDMLQTSTIANSQPEFLAQGLHAVTLPFVALAFWVGSYTMSREAGRLERRLGVGER